MHNVALATVQSVDSAIGALACAHQLGAIVAHGDGPVGLGPEHGRPLHCGRVGGASIVHGH